MELALQNKEVVTLNEELNQRLNNVLQKKEKSAAKQKCLSTRDPTTAEIYKKLIAKSERPGYFNLKLRLAFKILAVTGIRINELLTLAT